MFSIKRFSFWILTLALVLTLAACDATSPSLPDEADLQAADQAPLVADVANVEVRDGSPIASLHLAPTPVQSPYVLRVAGVLDGFGAAGGNASLWDPAEPSRRFHYQFTEGEARCEGGTPVAVVRGYGFITPEQGRTTGGFTHQYNFGFNEFGFNEPLPPPDDPRSGGGRGVMVAVTMVEGKPAELEGKTVRVEFDRALFSSEICDTQ